MMRKRDRAALRDCLDRVLNNRANPADAEQAAWMVKEYGWQETAEFCSSCLQRRALGLNLKPWCAVPADGVDRHPAETSEIVEARRKLVRQMIEHGISLYVADPIAALQEARKDAA